jgi:mannose-6-phosphate isomerase-like protein (cupin superfamily)
MGTAQCTVRAPGEGESWWLVCDHLTFKIGREQTGGEFALAHTKVPPGGGPPPHIHHREDEMFFILEGQLGLVFGDKSLAGKAGDVFYLPKGIVHTFKNVGERTAEMLVVAAPCGFEGFASEAGTRCTDYKAGPPPLDEKVFGRLMAVCPKYGVEMKPDHKPGPLAPPRGEDPAYWVLGGRVTLKLTSADTGGKFSVADITCAPGVTVPQHLHHAQQEMFFIREGALEFQVDGRTVNATAGTFLHIPAKTFHGFRNAGKTDAKFVNYHSPGGFEEFFKECGVPCKDHPTPPGPPKPEEMPRLIKIFEKHGMTVPKG